MNYKFSKLLLISTALFLIYGSFSGCTVTNLSSVKHSDFKSLPNNVYVDPLLSEKEYLQVLSQLETAKNRINNKYGTLTVNPVVIIVKSKENAQKYGIEVFPGTAFVAPWETYLVLNQ